MSELCVDLYYFILLHDFSFRIDFIDMFFVSITESDHKGYH